MTDSIEVELDHATMTGLKNTYNTRYNIEKSQSFQVESGKYKVMNNEFEVDESNMTHKVMKFYKVTP